MQPHQGKIWFPAKRYGWGWGPPVCWQGWAVMIAWGALLATGGVFMGAHPALFITYILVMGAVLTLICYLKGEKPRWRWGKD